MQKTQDARPYQSVMTKQVQINATIFEDKTKIATPLRDLVIDQINAQILVL